MSARNCWLPVILLVVCLHLVHSGLPASHFVELPELPDEGNTTEVRNERSSRVDIPRTIDGVLMNVSGGRLARRSSGRSVSRSMMTDVHDGLDMKLSPKQHMRLYSGVRGRHGGRTVGIPWTDGVIPYEFKDGDFPDDQVKRIERGMRNWEEVTCVRFRPAVPSDVNKVKIHTGEGCWAGVGMEGGEQGLNLNTGGCFWKGTVEHELGHTLGLIHEHQREQRDGYVKVDYYKADPDMIVPLTKYARGADDKMGVEYDYESVMHYEKNAFSASGGYSQTIYPRDPTKTDVIGMGLKPSFLDAKVISLMYKCGERCPRQRTCPKDCFLTADCQCFCKHHMPKEVCEDTDATCPTRASKGECRGNVGYTHNWCRKSCHICTEDGSPPNVLCEDGNDNCAQWAAEGDCHTYADTRWDCPVACGECQTDYTPKGPCRDKKSTCRQLAAKGECDRDPHTMLKDCPKACDFCPEDVGKDPSSDSRGCVDYDTVCQFRADSGWCQKFYTIMMVDCPRACGNCKGNVTIPANCVDSTTNCREWALVGECENNPPYMLPNCRLSCHTCPGLHVPDQCIDYDMRCPSLAANGDCDSDNAKWMKNNCRKSCRVCQSEDNVVLPTPPCMDQNRNCVNWAAWGECENTPDYMFSHCKKSCNQCNGGESIQTTAADCIDENESCPGWAQWGECDNNPAYMLPNCRKSCKQC